MTWRFPMQNLDNRTPITNPDGSPTEYFMRLLQGRGGLLEDTGDQIDRLDAEVSALLARQIIAGDGLDGGGPLSSNVTLTADVQEILDQITVTQGYVLYRAAGGWAALPPGTTGQVLQTNGAGADPAWAAQAAAPDIQSLLNGISTTQGAVLYRNATDWVALAPGTAGQFLKTNGAGFNPAWGTPSGSGGGVDYFSSLGLPAPVPGDFTVSQAAGFGGTASVRAAAVGVALNGVNNAFVHAVAEKAITPTTGDFTVTALLMTGRPNIGNWGVGIYLLDNAGKRYSWGFRNTSQWRFRFANLTDAGTFTNMSGGSEVFTRPTLYQLRKTGGNLQFRSSLEGTTFETMFSESATAYLTNTISGYGIEISPNNTGAVLVCMGLTGA